MAKRFFIAMIAIAAILVSCNPDSKKGATAVGGGSGVESAETKAQPLTARRAVLPRCSRFYCSSTDCAAAYAVLNAICRL